MAHLGTLRDYRFENDKEDIRGAELYGRDDKKLGKIEDVVFDHSSGEIRYAVVDSGGWFSGKQFLVPADRITSRPGHDDDFYINLSKEQIERFPEYNQDVHEDEGRWTDYETRYRESISDEGGVLHKGNSPNLITPDSDEMPAATGDVTGDFTPERITGTFTDPAPNANKIRMRPSGIAAEAEDTKIPGNARNIDQANERDLATRTGESIRNGEDASSYGDVNRRNLNARDDLSRPYPVQQGRNQRWKSFEDNLRRNCVDITASCRSCGTQRDKVA